MYCNYEDCFIRQMSLKFNADYEHYHIDEHTITFIPEAVSTTNLKEQAND